MNLIVEDYFEKLGIPLKGVVPLKADGSERRFYRLRFHNKAAVAIFPAPILTGMQEARSLAKIASHLSSRGINVPKLLFFDAASGVAFMEDKGKTSLQQYLHISKNDLTELYGKILGHLADFQIRGIEGFDPNWCYDTQRYDSTLALEREALYFVNAFLKGFAGIEPEQPLLDELKEVALKVDQLYYKGFLLHRDFQSRNILIQDSEPWIIDFQAARTGPLAYDVASLLIDPYVCIDSTKWPHLIDCYIDYANDKYGLGIKTALFMEDFAVAALLRTLQVLGAFSFLSQEKGKNFFVQFISPALARLKEILDLFYLSSLYNLRKLVEHLDT